MNQQTLAQRALADLLSATKATASFKAASRFFIQGTATTDQSSLLRAVNLAEQTLRISSEPAQHATA
jgi:hypothetical protein